MGALAVSLALSVAVANPAAADPDGRYERWHDNQRLDRRQDDRRRDDRRADQRRDGRDHDRRVDRRVIVIERDRPRIARDPHWYSYRYHYPPHRIRTFRSVVIVRPYGHYYPGYGWYRADADAFRWLTFSAITLKTLDLLDESQQRAHEAAQIRATMAPVGETVTWQDGNAAGSVVALREGGSSLGRYCREFQQDVTIGGRTERAYGTACMGEDGAWEIVPEG